MTKIGGFFRRDRPVEGPRGNEAEFLPAALEIQESPPSPLGRVLVLAICALLAIGVLWACVGTIDVVAVARGKVIPAAHSKVVQPLEAGTVQAIHVRDGQHVRRGDVLIEMDATLTEADLTQVRQELLAAKVEIARLRALLAGRRTFEAPAGADPAFVTLQAQVLREQLDAQERKLAAASLLVAQRDAAIEATRANITRLEAVAPIANRRQEHLAALVEIARLRALLAGADTFEAPPNADPGYVLLQRRLLRDQLTEYQERLHTARLATEQRQAAAEATRAEIARLEALAAIATRNAEAFKRLYESDLVSHMQYLELEERRISAVQALAVQRHRLAQDMTALAEAQKQRQLIQAEFVRARRAELAELEARAAALAEETQERTVTKVQELAMQRHQLVQDAAALVEAREQYRLVQAEFTRAHAAELAQHETRAAALTQEAAKAAWRAANYRLTAPIEGVVQQLAVHTIGGVVTPAQQLLVVVPGGSHLEVEALVENKDAGFVAVGQRVEVKIDTFPYTRYETLPGTVTFVSKDAVPLEQGGLAYAIRVVLARPTVRVGGSDVILSPGMTVTVDIKTGRRRLIEFLLSPLLRYKSEAARER